MIKVNVREGDVLIRRIVNMFFLIASCFIAICAGIIVYKLLFIAPCSPTGPQSSICAADSWSIAGLAATVLGVAATVLSFIGAAAIAYWWVKLDERVKEQVTSLYEKQKKEVNIRVEELLSDQKTKVDKQLMLQQEKIEEQGRKYDQANIELSQVCDQINSIIDLTFSLADVNPPWELEWWANDVTVRFNTPEAAKGMVLSYLKIVAGFLSQDQKYRITYLTQLQARHAPSTNLKYYWGKAEEWEWRVERHYKNVLGDVAIAQDGKTPMIVEPEPLKVVREKMDKYRAKVAAYLAAHPELSKPKEEDET